MRRDQLEHAIRTACQIIDAREVIIVGSQAILGSVDETRLPPEAPVPRGRRPADRRGRGDTSRLANLIEGVAGAGSPFEELHGYSIDGGSFVTAALPTGWRDRLVRVENDNTTAPGGDRRFTGWCLEPHDLCVAKLAALREKDTSFVAALLRSGIVDADVIAERLALPLVTSPTWRRCRARHGSCGRSRRSSWRCHATA